MSGDTTTLLITLAEKIISSTIQIILKSDWNFCRTLEDKNIVQVLFSFADDLVMNLQRSSIFCPGKCEAFYVVSLSDANNRIPSTK